MMSHGSSDTLVIVRRTLICLVGLPVAIAVCQAQTMPVDLSALSGVWEVTAVKLRDGAVQALQVDDLEYMGAVLDISDRRLAWEPHEGGTLAARICADSFRSTYRPRLVRQRQPNTAAATLIGTRAAPSPRT